VTQNVWPLIGAIALVLLLALVMYLAARRQAARALRDGRAEREPELAAIAAERRALEQRLDEFRGRLQASETALHEQQAVVAQLSVQRAELRTRLEEMERLAAALAESRSERESLARELAHARSQSVELGARLESSQAQAVERLAMLDKVKGEMREAFQASASAILDEKSQRFTEHNATHLGQLLTPLREQLEGFRRIVTEVYEKEGRERALLQKELETLRGLNLQIGSDAVALTRALKGDSRTQGAWGEMVLERLLAASGLEKGREYDTQLTFSTDDGRQRPDVIVRLPEGRDLVIDAKVSLTAYERYCASATDEERAPHMQEHLRSIRAQVDRLAAKPYADLPGLRTLDFVLMFVPVEAAFVEAMRADDTLYEYAFDRRVVVVTASTLLATLRTVNSLWRFEDRNRNALRIADEAGKLHDKFVGFVGDLKGVESSFDKSRSLLADALSKLVGGKGNLVRKTDLLRRLGARTMKAMDAELLAQASEDDEEPVVDSGTNAASNDSEGEAKP
jgi:DNA recombination protein RmuC